MSEKQDQPEKTEKKQETQNYFFPNTKEGLPFSCEAASLKEAEDANTQYLKQQKDTN
jgi:hypothetical protein